MCPTQPEPPSDTGLFTPRGELAGALVAIAAGVAIVAAVPELRHSVSLAFQGNFGGLRGYIRGLGTEGVLLLSALMLAHALIFYPTEIVTATAAYVYGFPLGLLFVMCGWLVSALLAYVLGRVLGRPLLRRVLGPKFDSLERGLDRGGILLLLSARLVPVVPFSLVGYGAGAARVRVWRFAWTTVVGFLPLTAVVGYLGSRAQSLSLSDPAVWAAVLLLVVMLAAARLLHLIRS
jgi:uncharacterized membrane protein YdjX (TVP38/TMEM64 family)